MFRKLCKTDTKFKEIVEMDYKRRAIEFWRFGKRKRKSIKSKTDLEKSQMKNKCTNGKHKLLRVDQGLMKLLYISQYLLYQFNSASDRNLSIHNLDLKRWTLKAREEVHLSSQLCKATSKWIHNFKI